MNEKKQNTFKMIHIIFEVNGVNQIKNKKVNKEEKEDLQKNASATKNSHKFIIKNALNIFKERKKTKKNDICLRSKKKRLSE